ncbi:MAG: methyltransferase domain-containing protein [Candidatus Riflebacteria bacterium]|nr:methyltransferase domain-containing protein [Candidatus Riflebacteria bacterium]
MPFYKLVGNRVLTWLQNRLTGRSLSEYHTGFRGYSRRFLERVRFEVNTNDFHFDTEVLLQAFTVNAAVVEFPIPTHYGEEICHVNGLAYAWRALRATLQYRLHQVGMFCSLKYRNSESTRYSDKSQALYSSHAIALALVGELEPGTLLDIGCGPGHIARLIRNTGVRVTGIDLEAPPEGQLDEFHRCDLAREDLPVDPFRFDSVLMLDVIEHLEDVEGFLLKLRNRSAAALEDLRSTTIILSTPNVAFVTVRVMLALGRFNYADRGILDVSHKRLFTQSALLRMLDDCGYEVERLIPVGVPFERVVGGALGRLLGLVSTALARVWSGLFAFQFMVVCRARPSVRQLLKDSETLSSSSQDPHDVAR